MDQWPSEEEVPVYHLDGQNPEAEALLANGLLEVERQNRNFPESAVEPVIEVDGTIVSISYPERDALPVSFDTSQWIPTAQTLDQLMLDPQVIFPNAGANDRESVQIAATGLLEAKVIQKLSAIIDNASGETSQRTVDRAAETQNWVHQFTRTYNAAQESNRRAQRAQQALAAANLRAPGGTDQGSSSSSRQPDAQGRGNQSQRRRRGAR
ncbi:hypothetical protein ACFY2Q_03365 [Micromonospora sp. NPDC000316]|uniref:hypothetical protein n=1 Tax=Micromonospora sp. NPDC000316 TaxID=3364216 RepID=UPI00368D2A32